MSAKQKSQVEDGDKAGGEDSGEKKKKGLLDVLKRRARFVIKLDLSKLRGSKKAKKGDDAEADGDKKRKEKPKKEKKPKEKKPPKEKKTKEKKAGGKDKAEKKTDKEGGAEKNGDEKKKFPIKLAAIIGGGAIVVGVIAFIIINSMISRPSAHQLLADANALMEQQEYSDAAKTYGKAAKADKTLVEAYLGQANALVGNEDISGAIKALETGLKQTGDNEQILARLNELNALTEEIAANESETPEEPESPAAEEASASTESGEPVATEGTTPPAPSTDPITFKDAAFEKMLRQAMEVPEGQSISEADLAEVTTLKILGETHATVKDDLAAFNRIDGYEIGSVLYSDKGSIKTLDDLAHFSALRKLTIGYNHVADTNGIKNLTSLETLGLYFNDITDLSGLSDMKNLKYLYVYNNGISNISPLANNTGLSQIWLDNNAVTDISPLKNLTGMTEIYLSNNKVTDISPVAGMTNLRFFVADNNQISDISALKNLTMLSTVSLAGNSVTDYSPVDHVRNVTK